MKELPAECLDALHVKLYRECHSIQLRSAYITAMRHRIASGLRDPTTLAIVASHLWAHEPMEGHAALELFKMLPEDRSACEVLASVAAAKAWCLEKVKIAFSLRPGSIAWGVSYVGSEGEKLVRLAKEEECTLRFDTACAVDDRKFDLKPINLDFFGESNVRWLLSNQAWREPDVEDHVEVYAKSLRANEHLSAARMSNVMRYYGMVLSLKRLLGRYHFVAQPLERALRVLQSSDFRVKLEPCWIEGRRMQETDEVYSPDNVWLLFEWVHRIYEEKYDEVCFAPHDVEFEDELEREVMLEFEIDCEAERVKKQLMCKSQINSPFWRSELACDGEFVRAWLRVRHLFLGD